jgi:tetratricopeptide (TPR) repeat protein
VLESLPSPDLSSFSEDIRSQLEGEHLRLEERLAQGSQADLASSLGRMGQLYHAYKLPDEAGVCYRNAKRLAARDPRWPYLEGVLAQGRGDNEAAAASFEEALVLLPGDTPALLRLAEMYLGANRPQEAQEMFERVLRGDTERAYAHYGLGRLASEGEEFAAAVEHFERALELQPEAKSLHYLLALAHRRLGNREEAERQIALMESAAVIFSDPIVAAMQALITGVGPILDRALKAYGAGRYEEAVAAYRGALELEPENPTALRSLGFTLHEAGRLEESAVALRNMVRLLPRHALAQLELATVLLEKGDLEEAIETFRVVLEQDPEFEQAHLNLGVALSRLGRWPEAAESFSKVLELDGRDQDARLHLAVSLDELGRAEESLALVRQIVEEDSSNWKAWQRLGGQLLEGGDPKGAAAAHSAVVENDDAPPEEKALAHYQLGRILKLQGTGQQHAGQQRAWEEAIHHFRQATVLFPSLWQARLALANTHRDAGRLAAAAAEYRQVVEEEPRNLLARTSEVKVLIAANRHAAARQRLEEGLGEQPRSAELANLLARHLATAPSPELQNGGRSLEIANGLFAAFPTVDHAETVAMALAGLGRFQEAVERQKTLIARTRQENREQEGRGRLVRMRRNLERYQRGQPAGEI